MRKRVKSFWDLVDSLKNRVSGTENKDNINVNEIADSTISLAMICRDFCVPDVVISEVLPKKSIAVTSIIRKVNDQVQNSI